MILRERDGMVSALWEGGLEEKAEACKNTCLGGWSPVLCARSYVSHPGYKTRHNMPPKKGAVMQKGIQCETRLEDPTRSVVLCVVQQGSEI